MYKTIRYERKGNIGIMTLSRPDVLNAFSFEMFDEINTCIDNLSEEDNRVLIITGEGRAFSSGADLKERKTLQEALPKDASPFQRTHHMSKSREIFDKIENLPIPTIAAINGLAVGGGLELALVCDLRIASISAKFGLTELKIGAIPSAGGTQRLTRLVGISKAKEIIMLGNLFNAEKALSYNLINEIVNDEKLTERAFEIAEQLSQLAPLALCSAKFAINSAYDLPLSKGLDVERLLSSILSVTYDLEEGRKAFTEKRKPEFKGK